MTGLKRTLFVIGAVQLVLGLVFLVPGLFAAMVGFSDAPEWTNWLFAMFGARALGFSYGMFFAARNPEPHMTWIRAMIGVQAIDWVATVVYLFAGAVTIAQVTTAAFLPVVFVTILGRYVSGPASDKMSSSDAATVDA